MQQAIVNTSKSITPKAPRFKVCGLTDINQMHSIAEMGVQFAGMVFYHKSPRFILRHLTGNDVRKAKLKAFKVGVFVNAAFDEVMNHVQNFGLDMVQLHGDETPFYCSKLSDHISVIKAFRITENDHIEWKIKDYYEGTDMFLFDTEGVVNIPSERKLNFSKLEGMNLHKSFLLSGGIEPGDTLRLKNFMKDKVAKDLFAIDINNKFEKAPGIKDLDKIRNFVADFTL